jgi:hypothetical protein
MLARLIRKKSAATLALALLFTAIPAAAGPVFAPGTKLFVIKTEHFDIIFPERSRPSALRLSSFAEQVYDEVAGKLETRIPSRIPVTITPDIGSFNGYTAPFPYMHIVLYDTSLDLGWTAFADNLRGLFLHELTHAVSLQVRAPWADFLSGIFGSWVLPGYLINTPAFMAEGVTVSFESADGATGRANDPMVRERVRQDIRENRFKSPLEASGLYDEYPFGKVYYEYGGLFSAYIQKARGMAKYAELWRAMGEFLIPASLDPYEIGFYKAFKKVYDLPFLEAWADFRYSLELPGLVDPPDILEPTKAALLPGGLAGNEEGLYWVDALSGRAMRTDPATGRAQALFDSGSKDAISDASAGAGDDSGTLLVTRYLALPDGRDRAETVAYDLGRGRFDPATSVADMREARFFRSGWVGIVSNLHNTDLVYASGGARATLLGGSEAVMYSCPAVLDEGRIALIVSVGGRRTIGILDVDSLELSLVEAEGEEGLLDYVRQLSSSGGKLYFNYDSDDRFYKLGSIDLAAGEPFLRLETTDYSGGVFWPRELGGAIYYVGRFSEGERVCRYPGEASSLGPRTLAFSLEPYDPAPAKAELDASIARAAGLAEVGPYRAAAYANPFRMWYAYPDLALIDRSFRVFGEARLSDPFDTNASVLRLGYDSKYPFAEASLDWASKALPVALGARLADELSYSGSGAPERQSSLSLGSSLRLPEHPGRASVFGLGAAALARGRGEDGSPYSWGYSGWNATASALLGWEGISGGLSELSARGVSATLYQDLDIASLAYKAEGHFAAAYDRVPLRLELWGAWASASILSLDAASPLFAVDRRPAYAEYAATIAGSGSYLAEGSLSLHLADQPIRSSFLGVYMNSLLVDLGCRGAWFREEFLASAFARASLDVAAAIGMGAPSFRVFGEAYARLSETDPARIFDLRLGIDWSADGSLWARRGGGR